MTEPTAPHTNPAAPVRRALAWSWSDALVGAVFVVPAAAATASSVSRGVAFAVGVLPAAIIGVAATRRSRVSTPLLGLLTGVPIVVGSILAQVPVVAVAALVVLAVAAVWLAQRVRPGQVAIVLSLPMVAIGLSFATVGDALGLAVVMVAGSLWAGLVSLAWPERDPSPRPPPAPPPTTAYGLRLGAAAATAAAIGFALDLDHVGWACAAALLVMRPSREMLRLRSVGRLASVVVGASLAIGLVDLGPADGWYVVAVVVAIVGVAATRASRWYITPGFTTFLVFVLLLHASPQDAPMRFAERVGETALGVGLAYLFGVVVPLAATAIERRRSSTRG